MEPDERMIVLPDMPGMFAEFEAALRRERQVGRPGASDAPRARAAAC